MLRGYQNNNAGNVQILVGQNNFLIPGPPNQGQPTVFLEGGEAAAFGAYWNCTLHKVMHIHWQVESTTSQTGTVVKITPVDGKWPNGINVHREHKQACPLDLEPNEF